MAVDPGLDHHLVMRAQLQRLAFGEHVIVQIMLAGEPDAAAGHAQPATVPRAQTLHAAGREAVLA